MPKPSSCHHLEADRPPSPARRIAAVRRQIELDYWFLKRHLRTLEELMKKGEKRGHYPVCEEVIEELKGLTIIRGAALFRGLGEVRRAVIDHQETETERKGEG